MLLLGVSETEAALAEGGPELGGFSGELVIVFASVASAFGTKGDVALAKASAPCWATGCFGEL